MMTRHISLRSSLHLALVFGLILPAAAWAANDGLAGRASWEIPSSDEVRSQVESYLESQELTEEQQSAALALWAEEDLPAPGVQSLERVVQTLAAADAQAAELVEMCQAPRAWYVEPELPVLTDESRPAFLRNNLRLYYGRWLAQQELYDEASRVFEGLAAEEVVDPASLLFYKITAHHFLLEKEQGLAVAERLLERQGEIPRRYSDLARLMQADLQPLGGDELENLDEIARLMNDITRRLDFGRAGTRVRDEQQEVLDKLNEMITQLEEQANQQNSPSNGGAGGNLQPSGPMGDSQPGGGSGPGQIDESDIAEDFDWGNLPPKEKEAALQQMTQDYPAHFREVIEEYYRRLARDRGER